MAVVKVSQGSLRGGKSITESGFEYYEFLGIPYAKPPVGELRFQCPQAPEAWDGERDATKSDISNIACQIDFRVGKTVGSEDCLYLNVYTPRLPSTGSTLLPVIVYIHGGGFMSGNGILKYETGPDFLLENETVVVSINYRLGAFGFLSLDIPQVAGNMGLKDQVKALEWVQKNISQFGGDSKNVTAVGLSAGSASVEYLILSRAAEGLFHKAILRSGSTLNHWAINFKPLDLARSLVKALGYQGSTEDSNAMRDFLLSIPSETMVAAAFQTAEKFTAQNIFFGFVPTVEKDFGNGDAFLTTSPLKLLSAGNFNKVPVLRGFCDKEGSLMCMLKPPAMKELIDNKKFVDYWIYDIDSNEKDAYNTKLSAAYLEGSSDISDTVDNFFGDLDFVSGIWLSGKMMAKNGVPVYMYQFTHVGKINFFRNSFGVMKKGALHGDDHTYLMKHGDYLDADEYDVLVQKRIAKLYTNFSKSGEPITATCDLIPVSWPTFTEDSPVYLGIDIDLTHKYDYEPKKMAVFQELYEKFGQK